MATESSSPAIEAQTQETERQHPPSYHFLAATVGWLFFFPVLVSASASFQATLGLIFGFLFVVGGLLWLASGYVIYDTLFKMAEARWPAAKDVRAVVSFLLSLLLLLR
jgi:hypothetical protein